MNSANKIIVPNNKKYLITFDSDKRYIVENVDDENMALKTFANIVATERYLLCRTMSNSPVLYKPDGKPLHITAVQEIVEKEQK